MDQGFPNNQGAHLLLIIFSASFPLKDSKKHIQISNDRCCILVFKNKPIFWEMTYMDVSENRGTPKSSILIGVSIINHPFRGTTILGNTHIQPTYITYQTSNFPHELYFIHGWKQHPVLTASDIQKVSPLLLGTWPRCFPRVPNLGASDLVKPMGCYGFFWKKIYQQNTVQTRSHRKEMGGNLLVFFV